MHNQYKFIKQHNICKNVEHNSENIDKELIYDLNTALNTNLNTVTIHRYKKESYCKPTCAKKKCKKSCCKSKQKKRNFGIFTLATVPIEAINFEYKSILYYPWLNSKFKVLRNLEIIFNVTIFSNSFLDIHVYDHTDDRILGFHPTIIKSGTYKFAINNPRFDTTVSLRLKKTLSNGPNPVIFGIMLKYE